MKFRVTEDIVLVNKKSCISETLNTLVKLFSLLFWVEYFLVVVVLFCLVFRLTLAIWISFMLKTII